MPCQTLTFSRVCFTELRAAPSLFCMSATAWPSTVCAAAVSRCSVSWSKMYLSSQVATAALIKTQAADASEGDSCFAMRCSILSSPTTGPNRSSASLVSCRKGAFRVASAKR